MDERNILILFNVQNGAMDPDFPSFLFSENGNYEESTSSDNERGILRKIPLMYCIGKKVYDVLFINNPDYEGKGVNFEYPSLLKIFTRGGEHLVQNFQFSKKDNVYIGGVLFNTSASGKKSKISTLRDVSAFFNKMKSHNATLKTSGCKMKIIQEISNVPFSLIDKTSKKDNNKVISVKSLMKSEEGLRPLKLLL